MNIILGGLQFFLTLGILVYEYRKKSMAVFLWGTLFIMFSIFHFLTVLFEQFQYPDWVYLDASLFVIVFCLLYLLFRILFTGGRKGVNQEIFSKHYKLSCNSKERNFYWFLLFLLLLKIGMAVFNAYQASGSIFASSWGDLLNNSREKNYLNSSRLLAPFFYPATALLFVCKYSNLGRKCLILLLLLLLFNVVITRNRIEVLPLVCVFLIYWLCNKRLNIKNTILYSILAVFVLYVVYSLQDFRYYGSITNFLSNVSWHEFNSSVWGRMLNQEGELGLRKAFYFFIYHDNSFESFNEGHTYLRMLLFWIPTEFSQGIKPDDFAIAMGKAIEPTSVGYSMHPTLFGDCYANLGMWGVFLGIVWAMFTSVADKLIYSQKCLLQYVYAITFACSYVIIGRGSVYNSFILLVSGLIVVSFVYKLIANKKYVWRKDPI